MGWGWETSRSQFTMKVNFEYIAQKKAEKTKLLSKKVYSYGSDISLIRAKSLAGLMKNLQPVLIHC